MAPVGPLGTTSNSLIFITISTVLSSWAPPGFSCPYFINYMKITVFIDIVTPNGLLNSLIFSFVLQIPNYRKNKENMKCLFFISISTVLSCGAPPMHMFFPLKCSKKSIEHAPVKTYEIQKTYLKPMK
jgi:hypothetical protein